MFQLVSLSPAGRRPGEARPPTVREGAAPPTPQPAAAAGAGPRGGTRGQQRVQSGCHRPRAGRSREGGCCWTPGDNSRKHGRGGAWLQPRISGDGAQDRGCSRGRSRSPRRASGWPGTARTSVGTVREVALPWAVVSREPGHPQVGAGARTDESRGPGRGRTREKSSRLPPPPPPAGLSPRGPHLQVLMCTRGRLWGSLLPWQRKRLGPRSPGHPGPSLSYTTPYSHTWKREAGILFRREIGLGYGEGLNPS